MTSHDDVKVNGGNTPRHRPGPFGPARILLPEDQKIETIRDTETTASALERMVDTGYSQLPVVNEDNQIIGVFSWQSFGKRMSEIHSLKVDLTTLAVKDTDLGKAEFIDPDLYIDTETDWSEIDHVLVGDKGNLLGVLSIADVLGRLNDFAEAFVLLYEIEHEIRDLILDVLSEDELCKAFEKMTKGNSWPAEDAKNTLERILERDPPMVTGKKNCEAVKYAIHFIEDNLFSRPINALTDFTSGQYREVIFNGANWPRFEVVFDSPRDMLNMDFEKINDLRNIVFHLRRDIPPETPTASATN